MHKCHCPGCRFKGARNYSHKDAESDCLITDVFIVRVITYFINYEDPAPDALLLEAYLFQSFHPVFLKPHRFPTNAIQLSLYFRHLQLRSSSILLHCLQISITLCNHFLQFGDFRFGCCIPLHESTDSC